MVDITKLDWNRLEDAIKRAIGSKHRNAGPSLTEVLRSGYQPKPHELTMLADFMDGKLKPANRPKEDPDALLLRTNPLLYQAIYLVTCYKRDARSKAKKVKGVEPKAIDYAYKWIAEKAGGAPENATDNEIEAAHDRLEAKHGYRLTKDRIADKLHRAHRAKAKKRT